MSNTPKEYIPPYTFVIDEENGGGHLQDAEGAYVAYFDRIDFGDLNDKNLAEYFIECASDVERLRQENERFRETLKSIARIETYFVGCKSNEKITVGNAQAPLNTVVRKAKEALNSDENP